MNLFKLVEDLLEDGQSIETIEAICEDKGYQYGDVEDAIAQVTASLNNEYDYYEEIKEAWYASRDFRF